MMMIYVVVVYLVTQHTTVVAGKVDCMYEDISSQFANCQRNESNDNNLDKMLQRIVESEIVNEEQLLSEISSFCSDEEVIGSYTTCTERTSTGCFQLASVIRNSVNEDLSVFCDNGAPAEWLTTVLQNGYQYNGQCIHYQYGSSVIELVHLCVDQADFPRNFSNLSVISAVSIMQRKISHWFQCMVDRAPSLPDEDGDGVLECGSTWQDVVLTLALRMSAFDPLGLKIGPAEITELKAIKVGY